VLRRLAKLVEVSPLLLVSLTSSSRNNPLQHILCLRRASHLITVGSLSQHNRFKPWPTIIRLRIMQTLLPCSHNHQPRMRPRARLDKAFRTCSSTPSLTPKSLIDPLSSTLETWQVGSRSLFHLNNIPRLRRITRLGSLMVMCLLPIILKQALLSNRPLLLETCSALSVI